MVFPTGSGRVIFGDKLKTWNAGDCCAYAQRNNIDDVQFSRNLIQKLKRDFKISKVYAGGMSNGGMMSYRLACEIPQLLDGIASVTGTMNLQKCEPKRVIDIFHIHALYDQHVLYDGGCGPKCYTGVEYKSVDWTRSFWEKVMRASPAIQVSGNADFSCQESAHKFKG